MIKLNFNSKDKLLITADLYEVSNAKGLIVLCHRSHSNRAEYRETAPKFNLLGYSCLAIDQRSGMKIFGEVNETKNRAKELGLPTGYLDARVDIESAIEYAFDLNSKSPIILLGSSYSASLALQIASKDSKKIKALITFSPGEYLKKTNLAKEIINIDIPIFATSAKKEIKVVSDLLENVDRTHVTIFEPKVDGFHGSKVLWKVIEGSESYWNAVNQFLIKIDK